MKEIIAVHADRDNFFQYGRIEDLKSYERAGNETWSAWMTEDTVIDGAAAFGMVTAKSKVPYEITGMTMLPDSSQVLFCADQLRFYFAVAEDPSAESIKAFYVDPGEVVVLNKGVWSDSMKAEVAGAKYFLIRPKNKEIISRNIERAVRILT